MALRVYNTLSKTKEPFEPVTPGRVGMYLCGPTVYKPSHIGHMVGPVIFDVIKRYLRYSGYDVTLVVHVTDVADKLIAEANKRGLTMAAVAEEMTGDYMANLQAMGIDTIDHFPKATECMDEIIAFVGELIERGFAYAADGDVYFDVPRDEEYGKLSGRNREQMQGEGGGMAARKRSPFDFALWKGAKPGEPSWDSPWGKGRPGWHIECSAMSRKILGKTFDIHGGGLDLVFPHHENEIAQSECCHGQPQAKYWMHNGLMQASNEVGKIGGRNTQAATAGPKAGDQVEQEAGKMGKSKGASAFRDLLKQFPAETIRFFLLATHYRSPIDYGEDRIREIGASLEAFYRFFQRYERITGQSFYDLTPAATRAAGDFEPGDGALLKAVSEHRQEFLKAMDDDFNTGGARGVLADLLRELNRYVDAKKLEEADTDAGQMKSFQQGVQVLRELTALFGMFQQPQESKLDDDLAGRLVGLLIELRKSARAEKNYALGDQIRGTLADLGVMLEDRAGGTEWSLKSPIPDLAEKLIAWLITLRQTARAEKNFALGDNIRQQLVGVGVSLEDRAGQTTWSRTTLEESKG